MGSILKEGKNRDIQFIPCTVQRTVSLSPGPLKFTGLQILLSFARLKPLLMRFLLLLALLSALITSCGSGKKAKNEPLRVEGSWVALYSRLDKEMEDSRDLYNEVKDSLLMLHGLKLLRFEPDGKIYQADSIMAAPGSWALTPEGILLIRNAGLGMERLMGQDAQLKDGKMIVAHPVKVKGQLLKVNWYYARLDEKDAVLLDKEQNTWRKMLPADATEKQVAEKIVKILRYYGHYFHVIGREANYFYAERMIVPFKYYQHGVGLQNFSMENRFARQFADSVQATKAWDIIRKGFYRISDVPYPTVKNNYTEGYALFIESLANDIDKFYSK